MKYSHEAHSSKEGKDTDEHSKETGNWKRVMSGSASGQQMKHSYETSNTWLTQGKRQLVKKTHLSLLRNSYQGKQRLQNDHMNQNTKGTHHLRLILKSYNIKITNDIKKMGGNLSYIINNSKHY